ncbi:hypothetical protein [Microbispora hainanensis]|uniref:hypothetical protein n=1 Tax=Microbispora hainanensis TaxID=568844 RepID=UPI0032433314
MERHEVQGDTFVAREAIQLSKKQLADLNSLPTSSTARAEWLWAHGAVDPVDSYIKLVLRGNRKHKVRIIAMRANTACEPPLKGTIFFSPPGGEDLLTPMFFNLDEQEPKARIETEDGSREDYFSHKSISLKRGEDIVIQAWAQTLKHYCKFTLQLEVLTDNGIVRQVIDNNGKPFEVSALITRKESDGSLVTGVTKYQKLYVAGIASIGGDGSRWRYMPDHEEWLRKFGAGGSVE